MLVAVKFIKMANIYVKPSNVEFSLPYSDGSGNRLRIAYEAKKAEVEIESIDTISVNKEDLEWIIDVLQDIKRLHQETIEKQGA
mgnify:CR=1 FL=1